MRKLWDKGKYIFIFLFSFLAMSIFMTYVDGDVLWNYGFSYAISLGEIPYVDFNMIIPPIYPLLMSLGLIINNNILVFYIENSLLITIMFYFLFKMYKEKAYLFLLFLIFPIPAVVYPTYNLFLIFLLVMIFYLEKNDGNDYLIGGLLGVMVFTKQTVGVCVALVGIIYYFRNDLKKFWKRLGGFLIPCILFLGYFLIMGNLYEFFNHCLFGLFEFTETNAKVGSIFFVIGIVFLGIVGYFLYKDKKDILNWYVLAFFSIVIPLFDINHLAYFWFVLLLIILNRDFKFDKRVIKHYLVFGCFYMGMFFYVTMFDGFDYPNKYNNFNYRVLYNSNGENEIRDEVISFIKENSDEEIVMLASDAYFYKITCDMKIDYFDLLNSGNHGYNGKKKLLGMIDDLASGTIMIIDSSGNGTKNSPQFMEDVAEYAARQGEEIKKIAGYTIYKKK